VKKKSPRWRKKKKKKKVLGGEKKKKTENDGMRELVKWYENGK